MRLVDSLTLLACTSQAIALTHVKYGAFTQTATYSIADQLGFFTANDLNVTYLQIPNSTYGYSQLSSGGYDILTGTIDNAANLRWNQNRSLTVLGQLDGAPDLVIAGVPNVTSVLHLRGKAIMVDSAVSGYAYVLRKVLSLYGLRLENGDYSFQVVGSTNVRYQYLTAGALPNGTAVYATILTYPFTAQAEALQPPLSILARVSDFIDPFASSAFTVAEASLASPAKRDIYVRFLAAFLQANRFLADSQNANCAVSAIAKQLIITEAVAAREYEAATAPGNGETGSKGTFGVDRQGLLNVIDVRGQFGGFASVPEDFDFAEAIAPGRGKLIDDSVRLAAMDVQVEFEPRCGYA